jgi:hypothetical protein
VKMAIRCAFFVLPLLALHAAFMGDWVARAAAVAVLA